MIMCRLGHFASTHWPIFHFGHICSCPRAAGSWRYGQLVPCLSNKNYTQSFKKNRHEINTVTQREKERISHTYTRTHTHSCTHSGIANHHIPINIDGINHHTIFYSVASTASVLSRVRVPFILLHFKIISTWQFFQPQENEQFTNRYYQCISTRKKNIHT